MTKPNQNVLDGTGFPYDRPFRIEQMGQRYQVIDNNRRPIDRLLTDDLAEAEERLALYQPPKPRRGRPPKEDAAE